MADLWIRTQKRKAFLKIDNVFLIEPDMQDSKYIIATNKGRDDLDVYLGFYDTEERALEVLDMIQYELMKSHIVTIRSDVPIEMNKFKNDFDEFGIAQIPQNSEIVTRNRELILFEMPSE